MLYFIAKGLSFFLKMPNNGYLNWLKSSYTYFKNSKKVDLRTF